MSDEHKYAPPAYNNDPAAPVERDDVVATDTPVDADVFAARYAPKDVNPVAPATDNADVTGTTAPADAAAPDPQQVPQRPALFAWLRRFFGGPSARQRLANLNKAIQQYPEAPSNYLLRGEVYLEAGHYHEAIEDFYRALELAEAEYQGSAWGILSASVRDRAIDGLMIAARKQS
jgi:tetratricopeptide (TPR) repeat protein